MSPGARPTRICFRAGERAARPSCRTSTEGLALCSSLLSLAPLGKSPDPKRTPLLYLLAIAVVIILFIILLGVIMAKRKRKHGSLWLPEGFTLRRDSSNHKRRDPVGQDAVGLK